MDLLKTNMSGHRSLSASSGLSFLFGFCFGGLLALVVFWIFRGRGSRNVRQRDLVCPETAKSRNSKYV
jgi:hypothetical protein